MKEENTKIQKLPEIQMELQKEFLKHTGEKSNQTVSVRLPKLEIRSFNGNRVQRLEVWQTFEKSIHNDKDLSNTDSFNYLTSKVTGEAKRAITGLALTKENYHVAVEILNTRFGDP